MLFNSFAFLIFFPIFFLCYYFTHGKVRLIVCLVSSYIFYSWWDWRFLSLIILVTCVNYFAGSKIESNSSIARKKYILISAVTFNLLLLGLFKYLNFFSESFAILLAKLGMTASISTLNIVLPVGISFYMFQAMSYIFDIYRNKLKSEKSLLKFATFVAFFPQLVAGPIVRAENLLPQLSEDQPFSIQNISEGMRTVLYGYFLKVVIADSAAPLVDRMLAAPDNETSLILLVGSFLFSFQIYCDFSGYSLIAIGLGKMMGFDFGINFNKPYLARNFSDFWQRWHISLSSWLQDYLYIPLGGNRNGMLRTFRNLLITMFLGGLWHGANWTFVFWGLLHGMYLVLQSGFQQMLAPLKSLNIKVPDWPVQIVSILLVFSLTSFAWIFFRAPDFDTAIKIILKILSFDNFNIFYIPQKFHVLKVFLLIFILIIIEIIHSINNKIFDNPVVNVVSIPIILWSILLFGTFAGNSFIYFQF